jgi:hypothetical protein
MPKRLKYPAAYWSRGWHGRMWDGHEGGEYNDAWRDAYLCSDEQANFLSGYLTFLIKGDVEKSILDPMERSFVVDDETITVNFDPSDKDFWHSSIAYELSLQYRLTGDGWTLVGRLYRDFPFAAGPYFRVESPQPPMVFSTSAEITEREAADRFLRFYRSLNNKRGNGKIRKLAPFLRNLFNKGDHTNEFELPVTGSSKLKLVHTLNDSRPFVDCSIIRTIEQERADRAWALSFVMHRKLDFMSDIRLVGSEDQLWSDIIYLKLSHEPEDA